MRVWITNVALLVHPSSAGWSAAKFDYKKCTKNGYSKSIFTCEQDEGANNERRIVGTTVKHQVERREIRLQEEHKESVLQVSIFTCEQDEGSNNARRIVGSPVERRVDYYEKLKIRGLIWNVIYPRITMKIHESTDCHEKSIIRGLWKSRPLIRYCPRITMKSPWSADYYENATLSHMLHVVFWRILNTGKVRIRCYIFSIQQKVNNPRDNMKSW